MNGRVGNYKNKSKTLCVSYSGASDALQPSKTLSRIFKHTTVFFIPRILGPYDPAEGFLTLLERMFALLTFCITIIIKRKYLSPMRRPIYKKCLLPPPLNKKCLFPPMYKKG